MKLIVTQAYRPILFVLLAVAIMGCDRVGDVVSGVGSATKNIANKISGDESSDQAEGDVTEQTNNQSASGTIGEPAADSAEEPASEESAETETADTGTRSGDFSLVFEMSHQSCASCGIWFDSAELVIVHSQGRFSARQEGALLIKKAPYFQGRFNADISSISPSASIHSAILYMHLNVHEGISNDDFTSSISVYEDIDGSTTYIREITARDDIKGKGYSKANPIVPIDFTEYSQRI